MTNPPNNPGVPKGECVSVEPLTPAEIEGLIAFARNGGHWLVGYSPMIGVRDIWRFSSDALLATITSQRERIAELEAQCAKIPGEEAMSDRPRQGSEHSASSAAAPDRASGRFLEAATAYDHQASSRLTAEELEGYSHLPDRAEYETLRRMAAEIAAQSRELETLRNALREIVENPDWDAPENPTTRAQLDRARSLLASSDPTDAEKAQFIADLALINENLDVEETTMFEFLADPSLPPVEKIG